MHGFPGSYDSAAVYRGLFFIIALFLVASVVRYAPRTSRQERRGVLELAGDFKVVKI